MVLRFGGHKCPLGFTYIAVFNVSGAFSLPTLWIIFLTYFCIACWTYGAGIPSGMFIPSIMVGASYGRFVATVFG